MIFNHLDDDSGSLSLLTSLMAMTTEMRLNCFQGQDTIKEMPEVFDLSGLLS